MIKNNTSVVTAAAIFLYTILFSIILLILRSKISATNCLIAGGIMFGNFLMISILWRIIFKKKSIALAVLIIIFKYLILGIILWNLSSWIMIDPIGLIIGFSSLLIAILTVTLLKKK